MQVANFVTQVGVLQGWEVLRSGQLSTYRARIQRCNATVTAVVLSVSFRFLDKSTNQKIFWSGGISPTVTRETPTHATHGSWHRTRLSASPPWYCKSLFSFHPLFSWSPPLERLKIRLLVDQQSPSTNQLEGAVHLGAMACTFAQSTQTKEDGINLHYLKLGN